MSRGGGEARRCAARGRRWAVLFCLSALLVASAGCPTDDPPPGDSGLPDALETDAPRGDGGGRVISPPAAPAPPAFDCPVDFRASTTDTGLDYCEPWPEGGALDCAPHEAHFPGSPTCTAVGSPCPTGEFPTDLPTDRPVVYVRAGATGGDGTTALPFGAISDALGAVTGPAAIVLAAGTYEGRVLLPADMHLRGACPERTLLTATGTELFDGVVDVSAAGVEIRDLSIGEAHRPAVSMNAGAEVTLAGIAVRTAEYIALNLQDGARLSARDLVVRGTRSAADYGGTGGAGVVATDGSTVQLRRAAILDNRAVGLSASGAGTSLDVEDVVVRSTEAEEGTGRYGHGIDLTGGATGRVVRAVLENNRVGALRAEASTLTAEQVILRGTRPQLSDGLLGNGLQLQDGADARVTRALVEGSHEAALLVIRDVTLVLEDLIVRDTESDGGLEGGDGLHTWGSTDVQLRRAVFERNREVGMLVSRESRLTGEDVVVRDTQSQALDGLFGRALAVQYGGDVALTRVLLEGNRDLGVFAHGPGATLDFTDLVIRDTQARQSDGTTGRGLNVQEGAVALVRGALFERNRDVSVYASGLGADVTLERVVVRDTQARDCATDGCPDEPAGMGVGVYDGASVTADDFQIQRASFCGAQIAGDSSLDLSNGEVVGNVIGACVQSDGYDLDRLTDGVLYLDNEVNLDSTSLPVPAPVLPHGDGGG